MKPSFATHGTDAKGLLHPVKALPSVAEQVHAKSERKAEWQQVNWTEEGLNLLLRTHRSRKDGSRDGDPMHYLRSAKQLFCESLCSVTLQENCWSKARLRRVEQFKGCANYYFTHKQSLRVAWLTSCVPRKISQAIKASESLCSVTLWKLYVKALRAKQ